MGILETLALALGSAWVSGIRLYATVAAVGLMGRYAGMQLPEQLQILTNPYVIGVASLLFVIEFLADKIPLVDSVWDGIHTFIRIPAGAVLAAGAFGDYDPAYQLIALLIGGGLAAGSHFAKTGVRVAVNHSPEPVSNWAVSGAEDVYSLGSLVAIVLVPIVAILLAIGGMVGAIWFLPRAYRKVKSVRAKVGEWIDS